MLTSAKTTFVRDLICASIDTLEFSGLTKILNFTKKILTLGTILLADYQCMGKLQIHFAKIYVFTHVFQ